MYDEKYKPIIQYKFSEFDISLNERSCYDKEGTLLESEVTLREEVRNNVQLLTHYTLRKLEDNQNPA
jgi:N-acetylglucosamine-6-phosphate deacetylase